MSKLIAAISLLWFVGLVLTRYAQNQRTISKVPNQIYKHMNKKIGALWSKKTAEGKEFFSGVISDLRGDIQIVVFANDKKENENQPDYNILLSEPAKEEEK